MYNSTPKRPEIALCSMLNNNESISLYNKKTPIKALTLKKISLLLFESLFVNKKIGSNIKYKLIFHLDYQ